MLTLLFVGGKIMGDFFKKCVLFVFELYHVLSFIQ